MVKVNWRQATSTLTQIVQSFAFLLPAHAIFSRCTAIGWSIMPKHLDYQMQRWHILMLVFQKSFKSLISHKWKCRSYKELHVYFSSVCGTNSSIRLLLHSSFLHWFSVGWTHFKSALSREVSWPPSNTCFLWLTGGSPPNGMWIGLAVFAGLVYHSFDIAADIRPTLDLNAETS